jgi:hypothetical protein
MTRVILLSIGWFVAALGLYVALVILELYWNLNDWQPKLDSRASGLIIGVGSILVAIRFLARANSHRIGQGVSLVLCLALLALAVYVFPREPLTQGLFARQQSSPLWYRASRLVVLASPGVLWVLGLLAQRRLAAQPAASE